MDQLKIGRFIAKCRKESNMTQMQLAEKLNITDRAVSKWETGKSLPDSSIMPELCDVLGITINDLFNGEVVIMDDYKKRAEELLLEIVKQKEITDKKLLSLEIVIGILSSLILVILVLVAAIFQMPDWLRLCLIIAGFIPFIIGMITALKIEQTAGYYECVKCGHKYIPTFKSVCFAPHVNRTRHMRCPKCGEKSWQKKVLNK